METVFFGRLGKDPELTYTETQKAICKFTIAIKKSEEEVEWKKVKVWERLAEICSVRLKKGREVFVSGPTKDHSFINQKGEEISYSELNALKVGFIEV